MLKLQVAFRMFFFLKNAKFSVTSSIVNEVIRGNFKLFFYDKILQAQKDAYKQTKLKKTSKEKVTYSLIYVLCFLCS